MREKLSETRISQHLLPRSFLKCDLLTQTHTHIQSPAQRQQWVNSLRVRLCVCVSVCVSVLSSCSIFSQRRHRPRSMCDCGLPFEAVECAAYFFASLHLPPLSSLLPLLPPLSLPLGAAASPLLAHKCGLPLDSGNTIAIIHNKAQWGHAGGCRGEGGGGRRGREGVDGRG